MKVVLVNEARVQNMHAVDFHERALQGYTSHKHVVLTGVRVACMRHEIMQELSWRYILANGLDKLEQSSLSPHCLHPAAPAAMTATPLPRSRTRSLVAKLAAIIVLHKVFELPHSVDAAYPTECGACTSHAP